MDRLGDPPHALATTISGENSKVSEVVSVCQGWLSSHAAGRQERRQVLRPYAIAVREQAHGIGGIERQAKDHTRWSDCALYVSVYSESLHLRVVGVHPGFLHPQCFRPPAAPC